MFLMKTKENNNILNDSIRGVKKSAMQLKTQKTNNKRRLKSLFSKACISDLKSEIFFKLAKPLVSYCEVLDERHLFRIFSVGGLNKDRNWSSLIFETKNWKSFVG